MTTETKAARPRRKAMKAEALVPALASLARLVELLAANLPSEEKLAAENFLARCREITHV